MAKTRKVKRAEKRAAAQHVHTVSKMQIILTWLRTGRGPHLLVYFGIASMVLTAFFFSEVLKNGNYNEIFPAELGLPIMLQLATAFVIAAIVTFVRWPATSGAKTVATVFIAFSMVGYEDRLTGIVPIVRSLVPILPQNDLPLISLMLLAALFAIGLGIGVLAEKLQHRYRSLTNQNVAGAVGIAALVLFAGQAWPVATKYGDMQAEATYVPTTELTQAAAMHPTQNTDKPDIYYIVLDRYASNQTLTTQFGFDNTPFLDSLRAQGFAVDDNAKSNYPYTAPSVASVLNMSYHNDDVKAFKDNKVQAPTLYHSMNRNAQAVKLLQQQGYTYYSIGSTYGTSYRAPLTPYDYSCDTRLQVFGKAKCLHGIEAAAFKQSPWYQFAKVSMPLWPAHIDEMDGVSYIRNQLQLLQTAATSKQQGGRVIFAHLLVPHDPYYFNADGSINPLNAQGTDNAVKAVKTKYTDAVQFINGQVQQVVAQINEHSAGKAVVLLISDEGPYPASMNQTFLQPETTSEENELIMTQDMAGWSSADLAMKYGALQAVHIPQATEEDLANMAPVNAFRVVLNRYFGYEFPYLPKCQLGLPGGRDTVYVYQDMTALAGGVANPACKQYE